MYSNTGMEQSKCALADSGALEIQREAFGVSNLRVFPSHQNQLGRCRFKIEPEPGEMFATLAIRRRKYPEISALKVGVGQGEAPTISTQCGSTLLLHYRYKAVHALPRDRIFCSGVRLVTGRPHILVPSIRSVQGDGCRWVIRPSQARIEILPAHLSELAMQNPFPHIDAMLAKIHDLLAWLGVADPHRAEVLNDVGELFGWWRPILEHGARIVSEPRP